MTKQEKLAPYLFVSPFFILFLIFGLYPTLYSIYISFFKWTISGSQGFVGLKNYANLLTKDPFFLIALKNTMWLLIFGSILQHLFAIPLAILLNNGANALKGRDFFKTAFFIPYITSTVSVTLIFAQLFDMKYGWLNYLLIHLLHRDPVNWLSNPRTIKVALSIMLNWRFIGWNTIIYLAGLQSISRTLYEAAEIDGAGPIAKHWYVTVPQLMPIIFFAMTMSIIGGMQVFDEPFVLLGGYEQMGGNMNSGLTSAFYLMFTGFKASRFGKASAIAWLLFSIILVMTIINRAVTKAFQK
ncbi:MAG: sugar ABC transporter permease [Sphaerochaeta sp.]|nr:sugar ABC transporter permease [Sphaerochaeta sp.]